MKRLNILAPTRYPWTFNGPRNSSHNVVRRNFAPLNKISSRIEGITFLSPLGLTKFDLVHAFNRIPLGPTPFIIGFESHLPRAFGREDGRLFKLMSSMLAGEQCRGIIAISEFARNIFLMQHENKPWFPELSSKVSVRYPNMIIPETQDVYEAGGDGVIRLVFVGNHFGRKGGVVAVRLAALAAEKNIPVEVDIVSSLEVGTVSWADPSRPDFFENDFRTLHGLQNIKFHGALPNGEVLEMISRSHFLLLPTLSDTFGFSAIEAMARHVPVVGTTQGCMREYIQDGENGIVLELENNRYGEWLHIGHADRGSVEYERIFNDECDRLAHEALDRIVNTMNRPGAYKTMREKAYAKARALFSDKDANVFWDNYYSGAVK